jgi:hypothetical protein
MRSVAARSAFSASDPNVFANCTVCGECAGFVVSVQDLCCWASVGAKAMIFYFSLAA